MITNFKLFESNENYKGQILILTKEFDDNNLFFFIFIINGIIVSDDKIECDNPYFKFSDRFPKDINLEDMQEDEITIVKSRFDNIEILSTQEAYNKYKENIEYIYDFILKNWKYSSVLTVLTSYGIEMRNMIESIKEINLRNKIDDYDI